MFSLTPKKNTKLMSVAGALAALESGMLSRSAIFFSGRGDVKHRASSGQGTSVIE